MVSSPFFETTKDSSRTEPESFYIWKLFHRKVLKSQYSILIDVLLCFYDDFNSKAFLYLGTAGGRLGYTSSEYPSD